MEDVSFRVNDLNLNFGDFHALKNINITIPTNKVISIIGPSGCGKSTFLRCLNRMNDLVEGCKITGEILLDGVDINKSMDVNHLRKRVGMVFQKANPFPMSIYDNIAYGPRTHGVRSKAKLDEIVEKSLRDAALWDDVKDRLKKSALEMSGGQQQRLCIARALAVEPEVLLMDEPFGALDAQTRTQLQSELLKTWQEERKTCFFITHDVEEAIILAQRVVIMSARPGRIKEIVEIDIPYPRTQETRMDPTFIELKNFIWSRVYQEYLEIPK